MKSEKGEASCNRRPYLPHDTQVTVSLVARPVSAPAAQNCAGANTVYSWAGRAFILEHCLVSKSFAAARETLSNAYCVNLSS
jgi:hypothetical protein